MDLTCCILGVGHEILDVDEINMESCETSGNFFYLVNDLHLKGNFFCRLICNVICFNYKIQIYFNRSTSKTFYKHVTGTICNTFVVLIYVMILDLKLL